LNDWQFLGPDWARPGSELLTRCGGLEGMWKKDEPDLSIRME
jgi:hypothetical protein